MHKKSGVDIDLGNKSSKVAYQYAVQTFPNRQGKKGSIASKTDGGFSNLIIFKDQRIGIGSDGTGTKAELAERTGIYNSLGFDLVAMVADDLAAAGLEPTNLSNVIDVDFLDIEIIDQLMSGLKEACDFAGISITGGEIAELGNRICGYGNRMHFNWSSTAIGVLPDNMENDIDGSKITPGDIVISLKSRGFRSNGFSAIRRILENQYGPEWHLKQYDEKSKWGEKLLTPSLIYSPGITHLIRNNMIPKGIAHITGGGIFDNLHRVLKMTGYGATLNHLFEPLPEMKKIQEIGKVPDENAYLWWNMGNGMLLVVDKYDTEKTLEMLEYKGYIAQAAGYITQNNQISIEFPDLKLQQKY
jgi:phosphoribosylformylglycinamidine cyclo-ligase